MTHNVTLEMTYYNVLISRFMESIFRYQETFEQRIIAHLQREKVLEAHQPPQISISQTFCGMGQKIDESGIKHGQ